MFLRDTLVQGISREIVKNGMENKLDQNMQPVTLSSMQSAMGLYECLGFAITAPYYENLHTDGLIHIRFDQQR